MAPSATLKTNPLEIKSDSFLYASHVIFLQVENAMINDKESLAENTTALCRDISEIYKYY